MLKAEIGDLLYIIIFAILIALGGLEKLFKKRQPQQVPPPPPHDDFEDVDEQSPQSLEEMMKRMMQTLEDEQDTVSYENKEVIPVKSAYQPVCDTFASSEKMPFIQSQVEEIQETDGFQGIDFEFDIRQAVISSEILNRRY